MNNVIILTDACSDLGKDVREQYGIEYVQLHIRYDGKELPANLEWDHYTPREFYGLIKNGTRITTTQVAAVAFYEVFEKHLKNGDDVVYIGCSSGLSGSVNTGKVVAAEIAEKYPDNKIYCIDCLSGGLGEGLAVLDAAAMRNDGMSAKEIVDYIEAHKFNYRQVGTVNDLSCLKRAGRIKASAAFFGNLFGIKPIIVSNRLGENIAVKKVKGWKKALDEVVKNVKDNIIDADKQTIGLAHADCIEDAQYLKAKLESEVCPKDIYMNYVGPCVGASTGPSTVMIFYRGKERDI